MTRETKIGLLVGLAFIIVVGILLSEHLTSSTERPSAPLADAGRGVRDASATPGTENTSPEPVAMPARTQPIVTARDFAPAQTNQQSGSSNNTTNNAINNATQRNADQVIVTGPFAPSPSPAAVGSSATVVVHGGSEIVTDNAPTLADSQPQIIRTISNDPFANDPIFKTAQLQGEPLVNTTEKTNASSATLSTASATREYKAQPGDTLSRIAALLPGGNTRANRDAVIKLNPTLQKDPNKIIAGRAYVMPTQQATGTLVKAEALPKPTLAPVASSTESFGTTRVYVVQPGDSLSRIASRELGSKTHIDAIRQLNEDVLKNGDVILVDMKLKLPVKIARAE